MNYNFYGKDTPSVKPISNEYIKIKDQRHLYDILFKLWCKETCAPRLQPEWSKDNITNGQCSITSFLIQDIFGGKVYGVPLENGGVHCFNEINGIIFDLTSEQFGNQVLTYTLNFEQSRSEHFASKEKEDRYLLLKKLLKNYLLLLK